MRKLSLMFGFLFFCASAPVNAQILQGRVSNSYSGTSTPLLNGGGTRSNVISFSHISLGNVIVVGCSNDEYPKQGFNNPSTGVAQADVNGVPLTQAWVQQLPLQSGTPITTEYYGLTMPVGAVIITVHTFGAATNGHGTACFAMDLFGVSETNAVDSIQSQNVPQNPAHSRSNNATCSYTAQSDDEGNAAVMYFYTTNYGGIPGPTITASPVQPAVDAMTGHWGAPGAAIAFSGPISAGTTFSESWNVSGGNTGAAISVGAIIFRKA
jgi:hypothetical protein